MTDTALSTRIMGILNVTPDSFSDGGHFHSCESALVQAEKLIAEGADILDIGGESSRPYAQPVSLAEELARTIPVIREVRARHGVPISIDTTKAEVARQALQAGANIVNDISAMRKEPEILEVAAEFQAPLIIMHMQGSPEDMQDRPAYDNVVDEILAFFEERIRWVTGCGIPEEKITIDPGIGFGKTVAHNLTIIKHLDRFRKFGLPVLLGHSRKNFLGVLTGLDADRRGLPTAVVSALAAGQADIIRVHDVAETRAALQVAEALLAAD